MIESLEKLKKTKKDYDDYREMHDKAHLGLSPNGNQNTLWSKAQELINGIELDLVDVEDCIADHSKPEDGLGGYFFPLTGVFTQALKRDVRYAIKSPKHQDTNLLIQQLKIVQKRIQKSAGTKQENEPETIEIDIELFYDGRSKELLKDLILTPEGVNGTSVEARNLRAVLRDKNRPEYKKVADYISKKRNKNIIYFDSDKAKFTIKKKNIPT